MRIVYYRVNCSGLNTTIIEIEIALTLLSGYSNEAQNTSSSMSA